MFKRSMAVLAFSFVLITLGAARLKAATIVDGDVLQYTNGFATCSPTCASVDLSITSSTTATITVTSLLDGYQFDTFGFNLAPSASISSWSGSGAAVNTTNAHYTNLVSGPNHQDGFGQFAYVFNTGINGGSTGSACVAGGAGCQFVINLTGTGFTSEAVFDVLSTGGSDNAEFAGHMAGSVCTGFAGGGDVGSTTNGTDTTPRTCGSTSTPEPGTLGLLGSGLLGLLIVGFRRRAFSSSLAAV